MGSSDGVSAGYRGQIGLRSSWAHAVAHNIEFKPGDVLVTETSAPIWGYNAELERAMIIGPPTDEMRRLFDHTVAVQQVAFDAFRPGATCADIDGAVMRYLEENGLLRYWRQHTGHGIGLRNHEAPFLDVGDHTPIEPGMVFTIEPGLYSETVGGFRHSDTIAVTADGIDVLTEYPRDLESLTIPALERLSRRRSRGGSAGRSRRRARLGSWTRTRSTIAPSSPAWNQCRVSGGIVYCSPGRSAISCQTVNAASIRRSEPCRRRRGGVAVHVEVDHPGAAAERLLLAGRAVERRMPMLGAGLAGEEHELLRAVAVGVHVHDDLEPQLLEPGEPEVGDLDRVALLRGQHGARGIEDLGGSLPRGSRSRPRSARGELTAYPRSPIRSRGGCMSLEGKTAVITGASRGIGAEVARMLHARGVNVGLASRNGDDLGLDGAVAARCDVRSLEELAALCDRTAETFGGIDIVVANAGVGSYGPFLELSMEHLDEMIDVNLKGTIYAIRAALPHMLGREGDVITLASEAGRRGLPDEAVYCASKFGQVGPDARARPRAARAGHPLHEHLPGRGRDRLRARGRAGPDARRAPRDDDGGGTWPRWSCSCSSGRATSGSSRRRCGR